MQTCSRCSTSSPDSVIVCPACGVNLRELSTSAVALRKFQENHRVIKIQLIVPHDACPACQQLRGVYDKKMAPSLPVEGCSHPQGCRCFYVPILDEIYP